MTGFSHAEQQHPEQALDPEELNTRLSYETALIERFNYAYTDARAGHIAHPAPGLNDKLREDLELDQSHESESAGQAIRERLIETCPAELAPLGLELSTPGDLGRDNLGNHIKLTGNKALPLAITVGDPEKFDAALQAIHNIAPAEQSKNLQFTTNRICADMSRVIRGEYGSADEATAADAERLLANAEVLISTLNNLGLISERPFVKTAAATLKRYITRHQEGTLGDYLGAERLDIVVEERDAAGPERWGEEVLGQGFRHNAAELHEKWHTALNYMKILEHKGSPLFAELFPQLRETFEASKTWFDRSAASQRDAQASAKAQVLHSLEQVWTDYFGADTAIYQIENQHDAAQVAKYAIAFGLEAHEVPPLPTEVDEVSVEVSHGLLKREAEEIEAYAKDLPLAYESADTSVGGGFSRYKVRKTPEGHTVNLGYIDAARSVSVVENRSDAYGLFKAQGSATLTLSPDGQTIWLSKHIPAIAEGGNKEDATLNVVVSSEGVHAQLRGGSAAGQTHYAYELPLAESIQAADALLKPFQKEIAQRS